MPIDENQKVVSDEENIFFGRGSVDMKAGVAVMMKTLLDKNKDVIGVFYTAEEGSSEQNGLNFLTGYTKKRLFPRACDSDGTSSLECQFRL